MSAGWNQSWDSNRFDGSGQLTEAQNDRSSVPRSTR
jgi:hypothetical protein